MIMESRNASFFKDVLPCKSKEELGSLKRMLETINENSQDQDKDGEVELEVANEQGHENLLVHIF